MGLYELFFTSSISDSLRTATIAGARHRSGRPRIRPGRLRHKSAHGTAPALTIAPDRVPCIHPNVGRGVALRFARPAQMSLPEMPRGATPREARLAFLAQPLRTLRDHCFTHILLVPDYRYHPNTPNRKWPKALALMQATTSLRAAEVDRQRPARARCPRPDLTLSTCSVESDLDFAVDDADGVGFQIFNCRRVEHLSGTDIKACGVEWALNRIAVEPSV